MTRRKAPPAPPGRRRAAAALSLRSRPASQAGDGKGMDRSLSPDKMFTRRLPPPPSKPTGGGKGRAVGVAKGAPAYGRRGTRPVRPTQGVPRYAPGSAGRDLAQFAGDVSRNFARGVDEAGRQFSGYVSSGGRKDPLAGTGLGRNVNQNKGKSWINR
jgi:hypothetical protein